MEVHSVQYRIKTMIDNCDFYVLLKEIAQNTKEIAEALNNLQKKPDVIRCRDCEFWHKEDMSLQGRCSLRGEYPTGAYFCGNAVKREKK